MFENIFKKNNLNQKKIFIVGTGRSGTHWLGYILQSHENIQATIEKPKIFNLVTAMALDNRKMKKGIPVLLSYYVKEFRKAQPYHYVDKSHPNLWFVEEITSKFPDAYFLGIARNPFGTVSSMLRHKGVRGWCERWDDFPVPNRFLGITHENVEVYRRMSITEKCAIRWVSHYRQMVHLKEQGYNLLVLYYDDLILKTQLGLEKIEDFLDLKKTLPLGEVKNKSLDKWKELLNEKEQQEITDILNVNGLNYDEQTNTVRDLVQSEQITS